MGNIKGQNDRPINIEILNANEMMSAIKTLFKTMNKMCALQ